MAALTQVSNGQITDQSMWNQYRDLFRGGHVYDAVAGYGADPSGASDATAAINNAVSACNAAGGGLVWVPPGIYSLTQRSGALSNQDGGIRLLPGVSLMGYGATLRMDGNAAHIYTSGPQTTTSPTVATVSASITAGTTNIPVTSSVGFATGNEIFCRFGENSADTPESSYAFFATVSSVPDGTHITLDRPIAVAFNPASVTNANNKTITLLVNQVTDVMIAGFHFTQGTGGAANVEYPILLDHVRNVSIRDVSAVNPGAGINPYYSENVVIDGYRVNGSIQQGGQASKGRALSFSGVRSCVARNLRFRGCVGVEVFVENYSQDVRLENLHVEETVTKSASTGIVTTSQFVDVTVKGCHISGTGTNAIFANDATSNSVIQSENLTVATSPQLVLGPLGANHTGVLRIKGDPTALTGDWSKSHTIIQQINLVNSMAGTNFAIPDGLNRSVSVYTSSTTGITNVYLTTAGGNSADWQPSLSGGHWVELGVNQGFTQFGSGNLAFGSTTRNISVYTGTVTAGAYLWVAITYLSP